MNESPLPPLSPFSPDTSQVPDRPGGESDPHQALDPAQSGPQALPEPPASRQGDRPDILPDQRHLILSCVQSAAQAANAAASAAHAAMEAAAILAASFDPEGLSAGSPDAAQTTLRGALRFRELEPLPAEEGIPLEGGRTTLPASRSEPGRPYGRPFLEKISRNRWNLTWDDTPEPPAPARSYSRWPLIGFIGLLAALGWGYVVVLPHWTTPPAMIPVPSPPANSYQQIARDLAAARPQIERVVRGFHEATTPEAKAAFIRGGVALLPLLEKYYATHPVEPGVDELPLETFNWVEIAGHPVVYGLIGYQDGSTRQFNVALAPGSCLLDWQSLTGWKGTDWAAFMEERPLLPAAFCVSAVPDSLYAGPFADASQWICLRIEDPSRQQAAWAYVLRGSPVVKDLPPGFDTPAGEPSPNTGSRLLTLDLRFPPPGPVTTVPMLEVTRIRHQGWFDPDVPK